MSQVRGATVGCICANKKCKAKFIARVADRKRGWAKCCSKSCAATLNNKKTGNYACFTDMRDRAIAAGRSRDDVPLTDAERWHKYALNNMEQGWASHKIWSEK